MKRIEAKEAVLAVQATLALMLRRKELSKEDERLIKKAIVRLEGLKGFIGECHVEAKKP